MDKKITKSVLTLAAAVVVGVGATFAAFTSNSVTISASEITTGEAAIKICNAEGDDLWKTSVQPALSLSGLGPGDIDEELTFGSRIFIGNDDGTLNIKVAPDCTGYGATASNSSVDLDLIPKVVITTCHADLQSQFRLKFEVAGNQTTYQSLSAWASNSNTVLPTFSPGEANQVKVFAELDSDAELQNETCTFDIQFDGQQPEPV